MKEKKTLFFYEKRFRRASVKSAVAQKQKKNKKHTRTDAHNWTGR